MPIWTLSRDLWRGNRNHEEVTEAPPWAAIESAIRALDQKERTLVMLYESDEKYMAVGGGAGSYVVFVTIDGRSFVKLIEDSAPTGRAAVVVGGQRGEYPRNESVPLEAALRAARTFADLGSIEPSLIWAPE